MKSVIIAMLLVPTLSYADHKPCHADIEKFCKDTPRGKGAIVKCLKEHETEVSMECKEKGHEMKMHMKEKMKDMRQHCKEDFKKFCADVKGKRGAKLECLKSHEAELSPTCKETLPLKK